MGREKRIMSQDNEHTGNFLKNRGERRLLGSPVGKTALPLQRVQV